MASWNTEVDQSDAQSRLSEELSNPIWNLEYNARKLPFHLVNLVNMTQFESYQTQSGTWNIMPENCLFILQIF